MATLSMEYEADLKPFLPDLDPAKADLLITDVIARAKRINPLLGTDGLTEDDVALAKAILRRVIVRAAEAGSGAIQQRAFTAGPYTGQETIDTRARERPLFYPDEVRDLAAIGQDNPRSRGAFSIDLVRRHPGGRWVQLPDGSVVDLTTRPDLWLEYA